MRKKVLVIVGTRPEAIKLAPLIQKLRAQYHHFETRVCLTGQHRDLVHQVLVFFGIKEDFHLNILDAKGDLFQLGINLLQGFANLQRQFQPDWVIVQGDTHSSFYGALTAYYRKLRILHVEAGLRTFDKYAPFPEELNRKMIGVLADYHAAPSTRAQANLLSEGVPMDRTIVCGNTTIDALHAAIKVLKKENPKNIWSLSDRLAPHRQEKKWVLSTIHRRENRGASLENILNAMLALSRRRDVHLIHILHPDPELTALVRKALDGKENISLLPPQSYEGFVWLMQQSYCLLTDSGGIQEEAPSLKKPVVIVRKKTERPLVVEKGAGLLVGNQIEQILQSLNRLLDDPAYYQSLQIEENPYGDGKASERIINFLLGFRYADG